MRLDREAGMSHDPYAPPNSNVELPHDVAPKERPTEVKIAVVLMLASVAISLVTSIIDWRVTTEDLSPAVLVLGEVFVLTLSLWLTYKIWGGRNWARIVLLVLSLVGWPMVLVELPETFWVTPVSGAGAVLQFILDVASLYLVFIPGGHWFKA